MGTTSVPKFKIERVNSPLQQQTIFVSMLAAAVEALQLILDERSKINKNSSVRKQHFRKTLEIRGGIPAVCALALDALLMCDYFAELRAPEGSGSAELAWLDVFL